jgi:hypothetical protein
MKFRHLKSNKFRYKLLFLIIPPTCPTMPCSTTSAPTTSMAMTTTGIVRLRIPQETLSRLECAKHQYSCLGGCNAISFFQVVVDRFLTARCIGSHHHLYTDISVKITCNDYNSVAQVCAPTELPLPFQMSRFKRWPSIKFLFLFSRWCLLAVGMKRRLEISGVYPTICTILDACFDS